MASLGLVCSAAGGIEHVRAQLVERLVRDGWTVAVTATPTAGAWLSDIGEDLKLAELTGYPVRSTPRLPRQASVHPPADCYAVVPATANTVAKLALGISDNQALSAVCEAIGTRRVPVTVFPRINAVHAAHPAWDSHIDRLREAGVRLVYGPDVWPLHEPGTAPGRDLPWDAILREIRSSAEDTTGPVRPN